MDHSLFIHSLTEGHLICFPGLEFMNKGYYEDLCANICVDISFQLFWVNTKKCEYRLYYKSMFQ